MQLFVTFWQTTGIVLTMLVLAMSSLFGQVAAPETLQVEIRKNVLVSEALTGKVLIEPHIAAHPTDPNRLLATSIIYPEKAASPEAGPCPIFTSDDGGQTWIFRQSLGADCTDPWVTLTEKEGILTMLGRHPDLPNPRLQMLTFFSTGSGEQWHTLPQWLGTNFDGPRSFAAQDGTVYFSSGRARRGPDEKLRFNAFIGKMNAEARFVETLHLAPISNLNMVTDDLAVLSDGTILVTFHDYQRPMGGFIRQGRRGALKTRRVWALISKDGGFSFYPPRFVTESCYGRPTDMAVDLSGGSYHDALYQVCIGEGWKSILLTYSNDSGEEWSDSTPVEPPSDVAARHYPQVAVNKDGIVMVAWMDQRDVSDKDCYAPYLVVSADGGRTFGPAIRIASDISCPDPERNGFAAQRWRNGGDYFGLIADANGVFHALWSDARSGMFALMTSAITVIRGDHVEKP